MFFKVTKVAICFLLGFASAESSQVLIDDKEQEVKAEDDVPICRVLSISGGGSKGAYEVGAINKLYNTLEAPYNQYDVISGVSVGSINALGYAMFAKGDEKAAARFMGNVWKNLTNRSVWDWWSTANKALGLERQGLINNNPLYEFLLNLLKVNGPLKKDLFVSAVDSNSGTYVPFDLKPEDSPEYAVSAVVGSASMPFVFPPVSMQSFGLDYTLIDGGSTWNNNMISGIKKCFNRKEITSYKQITLDVIVLFPNQFSKSPVLNQTTTYGFFSRNRQLQGSYSMINDIKEFMNAHPHVNYRYFIQSESTLLKQQDILEFGPEYTAPLVFQGGQDAKAAIALGPGKSFDKLRT